MPPAIVTDSIACLPREVVDRYGIRIVPINVLFEGKVYHDWVDLSPAQGYEMLSRNPDAFATSPPSPQQFLDAFREVGQRSKEILCVTISSRLSTLYNMARVATQILEKEQPELHIEVVDSWTAAGGNGLVAWLAAERAEKGANLAELTGSAEELKKEVKVVAVLETLRHVYRTGRVPRIASAIGSLLPVKPTLAIRGGEVHFSGLARSREAALKRFAGAVEAEIGDCPARAIVSHAACQEDAEKFIGLLQSLVPHLTLRLSEFSPIMGYATGKGTLALAYCRERP